MQADESIRFSQDTGAESAGTQQFAMQAINITKRFPGVVANDNVCLNVRKGEVMGLIGENGAGKSTLLKVLNGVYPHGSYTGTLLLDGREIRPASPNDAMLLGVGYVPQEINVLKYFSVAENIFMFDLRMESTRDKPQDGRPVRKSRTPFANFSEMFRATKQLLADNRIDLNPRADVRKLSIGQQQMLMIARALAINPKVLILDEPTTSLSGKDVAQLFMVIRHLQARGVSIIFVTHKLAEIVELTDRVTILRDGKNISVYERSQYNTRKIVQDMIGRDIAAMYVKEAQTPGDEVLRVENLTVEHPYVANRNLIENVSFSVRRGEILGMAGLVGAGRSEACMAIFGMLPVKSGKIFIEGKPVTIRNSQEAVRHGIGMVSEDRKKFGLNFVWDIRNNIGISNLGAVARGPFVLKSALSRRAEKYFKSLRVKARSIDTRVATLSGGNQQKIVIARSLNSQPKLMILDEPTKGIDVGSKNEIYGLINEMTKEGVAVVMISSELPELLAMSDRFVVMAEGKVVGELAQDQATETSVMEMATTTFKTVS
ncbi:MAG: sugar ABC transporter ATP-binding protein [Clostridiales bacterium]|nr:sugar ABC transporter ATP-binding protein [Clostridiales bacterium]